MIIKLFITLMIWNPELQRAQMTSTMEYSLPFTTYTECLDKAMELAEAADQDENVLGVSASCLRVRDDGRDA